LTGIGLLMEGANLGTSLFGVELPHNVPHE